MLLPGRRFRMRGFNRMRLSRLISCSLGRQLCRLRLMWLWRRDRPLGWVGWSWMLPSKGALYNSVLEALNGCRWLSDGSYVFVCYSLKNAGPAKQEAARIDVENAEDDLVQKTEVAITLMKTVLENASLFPLNRCLYLSNLNLRYSLSHWRTWTSSQSPSLSSMLPLPKLFRLSKEK